MNVKEGVNMSGLGIYNFHHMLCVEEGGEEKIIYLHLREPPLFKNKVEVFVLQKVTTHMQTSLEYGAPADSPFVPRKGIGGWVLQGLPFDASFPRSHIGWVWQEPNNGAIEFYFVSKTEEVFTIRQWAKGEPCYVVREGRSYERLPIEVPTGKWMHADVQTWADAYTA